MTEPEVVKTKDELLGDLKKAFDKGDMKVVSKIASEIAKVDATAEKVERDRKLQALAKFELTIKTAINKAVKPFIDSGDLDFADGIWYSKDFGTTDEGLRLTKGATRKGGGGGGGKKFGITTGELLAKHGTEMMGDSGKTFQQAFDECAPTDGNAKYVIRKRLLKAEQLI